MVTEMIQEAIFHINLEPYIYPVSRNKLVVRIRTGARDIRKCILLYWDRTMPEHQKRKELVCRQREKLFDYFEAEVSFPRIARYHKYCFYLEDKKGTAYFYSVNGLLGHMPEDGFFEYLYANEKETVQLPQWAEGVIYYQIFPERFCNGDPGNDPPECVSWGSSPTRENYMGGDLSGIRQKLPYLKELGIECIYLTPIFEGDFNHKYASTDYFRIDKSFGTEEDFRGMVEEAHSSGIRIILDGVFNHTGTHFRAFEDIMEKQEESAYKEWYYVNRFPIKVTHHDYECVGAYKWMPKLNSSNPQVRRFILEVMEYWIREFGVDGWRLDVADEVDGTVWQEARILLKEAYPDILLLGETWGYGGRLLQAGQMDGVMNYLFRDALKDYFGKKKITASEFDSRLNHMLALHKREVNQIMYNLLDSHDTERFLSVCGEDKRVFKLAAAFQFLFPGSPALYYGDEMGMTGGNDPDCRRAMTWDETADREMLGFYKSLICLRKQHACIRRGNYGTVFAEDADRLFGFVRWLKGEAVYVLINAGSREAAIDCPVLKSGFYKTIWGAGNTGYAGTGGYNEKYGCKLICGTKQFLNEDMMEYEAAVTVKLPPISVKVIQKGGKQHEKK